MITALEAYYQKRLTECGLTPETNFRTIFFEGRPQKVPVFSANEKSDGISITYCAPDGECSMIENGKKLVAFERIRYRVPRVYKDASGKEHTQRYSQPPKSGVFTYITPGMVEMYKSNKPIKTLFIVEGEFKAIAGDVAGLPIIGIGGIQNIKDKENNEIDFYVKEILERLKPENVVLLFDADCLNIKYSENTDLSVRLKNFYTAVMSFKELLKPFDTDFYFAHIDTKYSETHKGLDDLLFSLDDAGKKQLIKELNDLSTGKKSFVVVQPVSSGSDRKLSRYFRLTGVSEFYEAYNHIIQDREFNYQGANYYWDGEKVIKSFYQMAKLYIRVGCDFYKKVWKLDFHKDPKLNQPILILRSWSVGEINRDFGENKKFISMIPKYDQFVNIPCNTKDYKRIYSFQHEGITTWSYNRYNQVSHDVIPGDWSHIEAFLQHIFSAKNTTGETLYNFGLDYIQQSFFNPTQKMPVICLVSRERNTGKSTFLQLLKLIFQENCTILDNERFTGKFTSAYVDKLIVGLDEGFIPMEQKLMKERIKNYSTGKTIWLEGKGKDANEIENHIHLVMCSNDENNFMQIDQGENRFAVIKVKTLDKDNPGLLAEMEKEVGHFIYFLSKRSLKYPTGKSRFSFDPKVYETEALKKVQERTQNKIHREIKQYITDCFIKYGVERLCYIPGDLAKEVSENSRFKISRTDVVDFLKDELGMQPIGYCRYDLWGLVQSDRDGNFEAKKIGSKPGTPYEFFRDDFIPNNEPKQKELWDEKK